MLDIAMGGSTNTILHLLAALYQPVWTSAIHGPKDFGLALVALVALMFWKLPPWLVVLGSGILGGLLSIAL
jgi:chromate transporter